MASKGRVPPTHFRNFPASAIRPPLGNFPPFDMLPPPEVMAQKLSVQHIEIEKLAIENRRLASTQGTLRQDLAIANHDLQSVHSHIAEVKAEKEQRMRGMLEKMSAMESELEGMGPIKSELQKAKGEAQGLLATRQELVSKTQQLSRDLQIAHSEAQQIPSLVAELDGLRREYEHYRATYEYEKKLYSDHLESLQGMEKNYTAMSREVEKLRAELSCSTNFDPRTGAPYGSSTGYSEGVPKGSYYSGQNAYGIVQQGNSPHVPPQTAPYSTSYDPHRGPFGTGYNAQSVQTGPNYDPHKGGSTGPGYNALKGPGLEAQRGHVSDVRR